MAEDDEAAVDAVLRAFLGALDAEDDMALAALLAPGAAFSLEQDGVQLELDRAAWLDLVRDRTGGTAALRNALLMVLEPGMASFKVDTRIPARTFTDRILLRSLPEGWRIATISSC